MLAKREIQRWRAVAERDQGVPLAAFHDRLLWLGSLPLPTLDRELWTSYNAMPNRINGVTS